MTDTSHDTFVVRVVNRPYSPAITKVGVPSKKAGHIVAYLIPKGNGFTLAQNESSDGKFLLPAELGQFQTPEAAEAALDSLADADCDQFGSLRVGYTIMRLSEARAEISDADHRVSVGVAVAA